MGPFGLRKGSYSTGWNDWLKLVKGNFFFLRNEDKEELYLELRGFTRVPFTIPMHHPIVIGDKMKSKNIVFGKTWCLGGGRIKRGVGEGKEEPVVLDFIWSY